MRQPGASPRSRRTLAAAVVILAGTLLAGCSTGVSSLSFPTPTTLSGAGSPPLFTTLPPNLAATAEAPVGGVTTTTAPSIGPGPATLNGTVLGPSGPVNAAVVQADRLVGDSVASIRTTTAADGSWSIRNVLGGRYRVRAWKSPGLDLTAPQFVFVTTSQPVSLSLQLTAYPSPRVSAAVNPPTAFEDQPLSLVVQVVTPSVDAAGVLSYPPAAGVAVTLVDGTGWQVGGANPAVTDGAGHALFSLVCTQPGPDPLSAQPAGSAPVALQMPQCNPPSPATPTTLSGGGSSPTSSTCPGTTSPATTGDQNPTTTTTLAFGNC